MTCFQAFFLAIVQGVTEFLPISSSGHLVIFQKVFGLYPPVVFDILVHVGTLGAVIVFFRERLGGIVWGIFKREKKAIGLLKFLIVGSVPALVFGFFLEPYLEVIFNSWLMVAFGLLATAGLLFSTKRKKKKPFGQLNQKKALVIGFLQALAILPGVSRSGATISAGLNQGLDQEEAFEFSFFLAIPAIVGAMVLEFLKFGRGWNSYFKEGILGMIIAGVVGYFCLKVLEKTLLGEKFWLFSVYCLAMASLLFVFFT